MSTASANFSSEGTVFSRVFGIKEATSSGTKELCKAVPKGKGYYDD